VKPDLPETVGATVPIEFPKGIEVRLLNAGSWLANGNASLDVEVCGRASHKPAPALLSKL